eukprot:3934991-Rhodomonas_salina.1
MRVCACVHVRVHVRVRARAGAVRGGLSECVCVGVERGEGVWREVRERETRGLLGGRREEAPARRVRVAHHLPPAPAPSHPLSHSLLPPLPPRPPRASPFTSSALSLSHAL